MEEQIFKFLRSLRVIEPSVEFKARSRRLIFAHTQKRPILEILRRELAENLKFSLALGLASLLIFIAAGGFDYWEKLSQNTTALNSQELISEVKNFDFQIQLGEAKYFDESAGAITALLDQIKDTDNQINAGLNRIIF